MLEFLHPLLLILPPELAHTLAALYLRLQKWWHFRFCRRVIAGETAIILRQSHSLRFKSRLGLAAGFDKNAELFPALSRYGFGFIEVGTVTPKPQHGNPQPRLWRTPGFSLVNHMGFNSVGIAHFRQNILLYRDKLPSVRLFANIGKNRDTPIENALEDYAFCLKGISDCVDGFIINLSSPNTPGLVSLQSKDFLEKLGGVLPKGLPVFVKLSPDLENGEIKDIGDFISSDSRYAGIVVTNTSRKLAEEVAHRQQGGLSGPPLFQRALECVALARQSVKDKIVIGVGGISSVDDAKQMRSNGADLIEIYTAFVYQGPGLVRQISEAI
jgi:dihydroorotate dehydrogenase